MELARPRALSHRDRHDTPLAVHRATPTPLRILNPESRIPDDPRRRCRRTAAWWPLPSLQPTTKPGGPGVTGQPWCYPQLGCPGPQHRSPSHSAGGGQSNGQVPPTDGPVRPGDKGPPLARGMRLGPGEELGRLPQAASRGAPPAPARRPARRPRGQRGAVRLEEPSRSLTTTPRASRQPQHRQWGGRCEKAKKQERKGPCGEGRQSTCANRDPSPGRSHKQAPTRAPAAQAQAQDGPGTNHLEETRRALGHGKAPRVAPAHGDSNLGQTAPHGVWAVATTWPAGGASWHQPGPGPRVHRGSGPIPGAPGPAPCALSPHPGNCLPGPLGGFRSHLSWWSPRVAAY